MTASPTDHARFLQQLDAYLAGGLTAAERAAVEAHAAMCASCAAALHDAREADAAMADLFAAARPDAGFEDRLVGRLRAEAARPKRRDRTLAFPRLPTVHPLVRRAAVGAAAVLVLGGFGYVAQQAFESGRGLPTPWAANVQVDAQKTPAVTELSLSRRLSESAAKSEHWPELGRELDAKGTAEAGKKLATGSASSTVYFESPGGAQNHSFYAQTPEQMARESAEAARAKLGGITEQGGETYNWRFTTQNGRGEPAAAPAGNAVALDVTAPPPTDAPAGGPQPPAVASTPPPPAASLATSTNGSAPAGPVAAKTSSLGVSTGRQAEGYGLITPDADRFGRPSSGGAAANGAEALAKGLKQRAPDKPAEVRAFKPGTAFADDYATLTQSPAADAPRDGKFGEAKQRGDVQDKLGAKPAQPKDQYDSILKPADDEGDGIKDSKKFFEATGKSAETESLRRNIEGTRILAQRERARTVAELNQTAERLTAAGRMEEAKGVVDQIKVLDPTNEFAAGEKGGGAAKSGSEVKDIRDLITPVPDFDAEPQFNLNQSAQEKAQPAPQSQQSPPPATQPTTGGSSGPATPATPPAAAQRRIIRNGEMTFEVDGFDSALLQVTKIADEEGGFVATTTSEKLPNGKVKGAVVVRVPPERLDTLVLKLRGLGDLKASRIGAQDVTKQYTDIESQLKAGRAMEARLLDIIRTGKGEIKDLIEAEKQLGVWREKIEMLEGEIRYYNNLISLSTLTVNLVEREIRNAAMVSESEQVNMGLEADDVEQARAAALKAVEDAKGRIVASELKKLPAGQYLAQVVAEVKPDASGPLTDRLKQIGRVARLEVERKQASPEGTTVPTSGVRVERRDTRFVVSLYNLANVDPRTSTTLNLAAADVEVAYRAILDQVKSAGGRVVTSQLNRQGPTQTTGTLTFQVPADQADVLLGALRSAGEVMRLDVNQNPDVQNTTETKRGFVVQVFALATVPARETTELQIAATKVPASFGALREAVRSAGGRILTSQLSAQDANNSTGQLVFEVPREQWGAVDQALGAAGEVVSRSVNRAAEGENAVDTKVRLSVTLVDEARLNPRQTVEMRLAVRDVAAAYGKLLEALRVGGARVLTSQLSDPQNQQNVTGTLVFDVRGEPARAALEKAIDDAGDVYGRTVNRSSDGANVIEDKTRLSVTLIAADRLPPRQTTTMGLEVEDVERAKGSLEATAIALGGAVNSTISRERTGATISQLTIQVPLSKQPEMLKTARDQGKVLVVRDESDPTVPAGELTRAKLSVTLATPDQIQPAGTTLGSSIRGGLRYSLQGLLWSLQWVIVGLCFVLPWVLLVWALARVVRRSKQTRRGRDTTTIVTPPPAAPPATA